MRPIRFGQANVEFKGGSPNVSDLWVFRGRDTAGNPVIVSAWKPEPDELVKINLGEPVYLTTIGTGIPPAHLTAHAPWEKVEEIDTTEDRARSLAIEICEAAGLVGAPEKSVQVALAFIRGKR